MASYIVDTAPGLLLNVALAAVDGMTRGVTVTAMPVLLSSSPASPLASTSASAGGAWWAAAVLGAIATNGGGWIASSLGMHRAQWTAGAPPILSGFGFWSTLDVWGAMLSGVVYAALTRTYPALNSLGDVLAACIPDELRDAGLLKRAGGQVVSNDTARAIAVFLLGALFVLRALALQVREWCGAAARARAVKDEIKDTVPLIPATVVKSPVEASPAAASGAKPKKRKNRKGRSPSAAA